MAQICFKFYYAKDIDSSDFSQIYIQLTPQSGVEEASPQNSREGKAVKGTFKFDEDDQIVFTLVGDASNCSFGVKLFLKSQDAVNCYDGVGQIGPLQLQDSDMGTKLECVLYDNGEEDLPFGVLTFSWMVRDAELEVFSDEVERQLDEDDMHQLVNDIDQQFDGVDVVHDNEEDGLEDISPIRTGIAPHKPPSALGSQSVVFNQTDDDDEYDQDSAHDSPIKTKSIRPTWSKFDDYQKSIAGAIKNDVTQLKSGSFNISLKIHTAMLTLPSSAVEKPTAAQVKLSIQPIPGKANLLRTKNCEDSGDGGFSFDFGMQGTTLSMTVAELHSKAYVSGCSPNVQVDFSSGSFTASGSMYLPELIRQSEGKLLVLHLVPKRACDVHGLQDSNMYSRQGGHLDGNVSVIIEVSKEYQASATTSSVLGTSATNKTRPPPVETQIPRADVTVVIKGIYGSGLKNVSNCLVDVSLCASGIAESSGLSTKTFRKGVSVNHKCRLHSECADLDVLQLKVYQSDGDRAAVLGIVQFPLMALTRNNSHVSGCFQAVSIEPSSTKGATVNLVSVLKWGIVCDVSCSPAQDSNVCVSEDGVLNGVVDDEDKLMEEMDELGPTESHVAKRVFETVKSVDGQLSVCVHGFIPKYGGTCALTTSDVLSVEFSLPNSSALNEKTEPVRVSMRDEHDATSSLCALWDKEFLVPVVWALQQRFVGFLQGVVVRTTSVKSDPKQTKSIIGCVSLDMASMVNMKDKPIVCALPVVHKLCSHEDYQDCIGYIMLGLQFDNTGAGHSRCSNPDCMDHNIGRHTNKKITLKKSVAWGEGTVGRKMDKKIKPHEANSPLPLPPSAFSALKKLCLERWPLFCKHLTGEYARLVENEGPRNDLVNVSVSLNSIEAVAGPLRQLQDDETITVVLGSNDESVLSGGSVDIKSGKISLRRGDLDVPLNLESNASILVSMKITRDEDNDVLGVASIVLPRELVITGRPMNIAVPLRDSSGLKVAVIVCGCHFASSGFNAITAPLSEKEDENDSNYLLDVCVIEGSVRDGEWTQTMEPYFECSLISPAADMVRETVRGISALPPSTNCVGYTPTVDVNSPGDWNARCSIPIPLTALSDSMKPTSLWSLDIKCRDGSRVKYPHIGQTQVSIPWSVLGRGKDLDVWVNMVPTLNSSNVMEGSVFDADDGDDVPEGENMTSVAHASRLHIRLERKEKTTAFIDVENTSSFPGVGQIAMWYHSIREGESHSERSYGADDIRSVDAVVQMSNPSTELFEHEEKHVPFRSSTIEARQSVYDLNRIADMLCGHVTVPGGRSVTHLRLRTKHERFPLLTSLPTFSTLPKPSPAAPRALSTDIPIIETVLRPDSGGNYTASIRQRLSRLKIGAVFVPYVCGYMYVQQSNLEVHDTAAERFEQTPVKRGALKYSLGGLGSCFTPSFQMGVSLDQSTIDDGQSRCSSLSFKSHHSPRTRRGNAFKRNGMKPVSPAGGSGILKKSSKPSKLRRLVATHKGSPSPRANASAKTNDPADIPYIFVNTYEMLSGLGKSSDDTFDLRVSLLDLDSTGKRYVMGVGHLQTAAIYFQALRSIFSVENRTSIIARCTVPTPVELFDPVRRIHVATVMITLKFELTAVSPEVINFLRAHKQNYCQAMSPNSEVHVGRAELGLKQAFQVADKDNSGGVSAAELVSTIRSITSKSNKGHIVGFDTGAIRLLLSLMEIVNGPPPDEDSAYSEERIAQLFRTMDLDGDGSVSWWEWRQVLDGTSTVMAQGEPHEDDPPRYVDSLDPLVVSLEAAHAALMAEHGGIVKPKLPRALEDDDLNALDGSPSKRNKRYQDKLARLKSKNSRLQQRLEEALSTSQVMTASPTRSRRFDEADDEIRKMLETERRRRAELESEVDRLNNVSSEMVKSRSAGELERDRVNARLALEADRLREEMILTYMGRKRHEKNSYVLKRFFLLAREKMLQKRIAREQEKLQHAMNGLVTRKKFLSLQVKRNNAATKIQSQQRRIMAKNRVRLMHHSVRKIQEAVLLRKLRKAAQHERAELLHALTLLRWNAANEAQEAKKKEEEERRRREKMERSAVKIQSMYRGYLVRRNPREDNTEPMILKIVDKPPIEHAVGLWISHPRHKKPRGDTDEREALVVHVDFDTENMKVRYLEEEPVTEAMIYYDDPRITHWFKMSTKEEERIEIAATTKLQAIIRGR